ncbi:MAG: carbohydrate binding family 9 domain-containing protein [Planctomycetota bacterium]
MPLSPSVLHLLVPALLTSAALAAQGGDFAPATPDGIDGAEAGREAQESADESAPDAAQGAPLTRAEELAQLERPSARLRPLGPDVAPPDLNGILDDAVWASATRLGPLVQTVPIEGGPVTYPTDVLLTYDADFVYVGLFAHDDPAEVRARQMDRDAFVRYDDVIELWFDPFASERFAYWFQVTPAGSLGDALISDNGSSFNKQWDGIWYGAAHVGDAGWSAELAFPIKTLSFDPDAPWWGFNVVRRRVANGESSRWASPSNAYRFFQISEGGKLLGIEGLRQGVGLDVVPYVKTQLDRPESFTEFDGIWDVGVDVRWRPTATSTLLVTTNTDFAETEVDTRQINTNRFPLFFPERRDFFLEDAGVFEFGAPSASRSIVPFFSRRIGLSDRGEVVPIRAGVKLTGRFGDWTVGALDTYVGSVDGTLPSGSDPGRTGVPGQNLGVVRMQRALGEGQQVGLVATTGDPGGDRARTTLGLDALFGSPRAFGDGVSGFLWPWLLATVGGDDDATRGSAYGLDARIRTRNWNADAVLRRVGRDFDPALGFVRRRGFQEALGSLDYTWYAEDTDTLFRQVESGFTAGVIRDLRGDEDAWSIPVRIFEGQFWSQDSVSATVTRRNEVIDTAFDLGDTATVEPGDYTDTRYTVEFESNDRRLFGLETSLEAGDFYGGDITRLRVSPIYIPSKFASFSLDYQDVVIETPAGGRLHTELFGVRADFKFDPFTSWFNLAQYDTDSNDMSVQSRVRWILEPGRELFLVGLFGFDKEDTRSSFTTGPQSLALKLEATFRF